MIRAPASRLFVLTATLLNAGCTHHPPASLTPLLERYVGCYAISAVGVHSPESTWRTLRLTAIRYRDTTSAAYLAYFPPGDPNYYWYLRGDTIQLRSRSDRGMVNGWVDSLVLWPRGNDFTGHLHETSDMLSAETDWQLVAGRIWCQF